MHPITTTREDLLNASGDDETFRQCVHDLFAIASRMEIFRSGFGKLVDLTGVEYSILVASGHLVDNGPVFVNALAEHLHLSGAFVTLQTNHLAKKGLLLKVKDPSDGRRVQLQLTKKAHRALESLSPAQCQVNDVLFGGFSKRDFRKFISLIGLLMDGSADALPLLHYLESQHPQSRR